MKHHVLAFLALVGLTSLAVAFSPAVSENDGLKIEIPDLETWTQVGVVQPVVVKVTNTGAEALVGRVELGLLEPMATPQPQAAFNLQPGQSADLSFPVTAGPGLYRAHYPIHATARFQRGGAQRAVHTVLLVKTDPPIQPATTAASPPVITVPVGVLALAVTPPQQLVVQLFGQAERTLPGTAGGDTVTRADFSLRRSMDRGETRMSIAVHPPWSGGAGTVAGDWRLNLPGVQPITFTTGLALRDTAATEPDSDGVTLRVKVDGKTELERHVASKTWVDLSCDLSAYAGREVTLRLEIDPGPARNTSCDGAYLGSPLLSVGPRPASEPAEAKAGRAVKALVAARAALAGNPSPGSWRLESEAGRSGVAVVPGPIGLPDAQLAIVGSEGELVIDGVEVLVSDVPLAQRLVGDASDAVKIDDQGAVWTYTVADAGREMVVLAAVRPVRGQALEVSLAMKGERAANGRPRFTRLAFGPASAAPRRVLFGHGNALDQPTKFRVGYGGFSLSTRFVGLEFASGLSLVQAVDSVPDALEHDPERRITTLVSPHDTTFTLIPSERGAFAAARVWRGLNGLHAAPGVSLLAGRMCLDQWGGDYGRAATDLQRATRYGLDKAVFVKHVWQRWGYDYRLPDIYPPAGDRADFDAMIKAAELNGRLMCLHDNYIDFYPDADGYSYDQITFGGDGQPQQAWLNEGREAQSYRWLPTAYWPYLERNINLLRQGVGPMTYFIDVFSAAAPYDGYDRAGRYFTRQETNAIWGRTFDYVRDQLGQATISEAGTDALIGHLDAAQADHTGVRPESASFSQSLTCTAADRVPWFDMAHHRRFIQFAGGLGNRYAGGLPDALHGYGSDDYLTLTVLCGRSPMADGPFNRRAVMTYWLLQPLCEALEHQEMLAHEFVGDDVRRQRVTWEQGSVTVNRGPTDWTVDGQVLPEYGLVAKVGEHSVDISRRDGVITASAAGPDWRFFDGRAPSARRASSVAGVREFTDLGQRRYRLVMDWDINYALPTEVRPFMHMTGDLDRLPGATRNADILWQTDMSPVVPLLTQVGPHQVVLTGQLPDGLKAGDYGLAFGLYSPGSGQRWEVLAPATDGGRYDGGKMTVTGEGTEATMSWQPAPPAPPERANLERRVINFGPVETDLGLRLTWSADALTVTLLPECAAGQVVLHLDQLGVTGTPGALTQVAEDGQTVGPAAAQINGRTVRFTTAEGAFAYRLALD